MCLCTPSGRLSAQVNLLLLLGIEPNEYVDCTILLPCVYDTPASQPASSKLCAIPPNQYRSKDVEQSHTDNKMGFCLIGNLLRHLRSAQQILAGLRVREQGGAPWRSFTKTNKNASPVSCRPLHDFMVDETASTGSPSAYVSALCRNSHVKSCRQKTHLLSVG